MPKNEETELKLRLIRPEAYDRIVADQALMDLSIQEGGEVLSLDNTYYDTADHRLLDALLTLRLRDTGEERIATVKNAGTITGGLFSRGEWNLTLGEEPLTAQTFADTAIGAALAEAVGDRELEPICKTDFQRITRMLHVGDARIEFAADRGEITAGDKRELLCEVELELKDGDVNGLLQTGSWLAERYPLLVEKKSKFERGLRLAGFAREQPAAPAVDAQNQTIRQALTDGMLALLDKAFAAFEVFVLSPQEPEAVHKLRVALRRLRAVLSYAKPVMEPEAYRDIVGRIKTVADETGYIRELDVLLEKWLGMEKEPQPQPLPGQTLEELLTERRQTALQTLLARYEELRPTAALLYVWSLLLGEAWSPKADAPYLPFAQKRLKKWKDNVAAGAGKKPEKDLTKAHRLRIRGKKVRYVQEMQLAGGMEPDGMEPEKLRSMLTRLGTLHDADRNIVIVRELMKTTDSEQAHWEGKCFIRLEKQALKAFRKQKPMDV